MSYLHSLAFSFLHVPLLPPACCHLCITPCDSPSRGHVVTSPATKKTHNHVHVSR